MRDLSYVLRAEQEISAHLTLQGEADVLSSGCPVRLRIDIGD